MSPCGGPSGITLPGGLLRAPGRRPGAGVLGTAVGAEGRRSPNSSTSSIVFTAWNVIEFRNYKKFTSDSNITFDPEKKELVVNKFLNGLISCATHYRLKPPLLFRREIDCHGGTSPRVCCVPRRLFRVRENLLRGSRKGGRKDWP